MKCLPTLNVHILMEEEWNKWSCFFWVNPVECDSRDKHWRVLLVWCPYLELPSCQSNSVQRCMLIEHHVLGPLLMLLPWFNSKNTTFIMHKPVFHTTHLHASWEITFNPSRPKDLDLIDPTHKGVSLFFPPQTWIKWIVFTVRERTSQN